MTHNELVDIGKQWLINKGCSVVITEMCGAIEEPDAIGWIHGKSILIECKTSIKDFRQDADKIFRRQAEHALGIKRYFMVPDSLSQKIFEEMKNTDWGLIRVNGAGTRVVKESADHTTTRISEINLLLSAIRSIGKTAPKGISVRYYEIESKVNRATLGVKGEDDDKRRSSNV